MLLNAYTLNIWSVYVYIEGQIIGVNWMRDSGELWLYDARIAWVYMFHSIVQNEGKMEFGTDQHTQIAEPPTVSSFKWEKSHIRGKSR